MQSDIEKKIGELSALSAYEAFSKIDTSYDLLTNFALCPYGSVSDTTINEWTSAVLNPTTGIPYAVDILNKRITGHVVGNEEGLLETMTGNMIDQLYISSTKGVQTYGRDYRTKVLNLYLGFEDYFGKLLYYELRGLAVMAEGYHARNETALLDVYLQNTWGPTLQNQVNIFIAQTERFVVNAESQAEMEFPNMGPVPASDYDKLNAYWQNLFGYDYAIPSVAEILPRVDQAADIILNGNGTFTARVLVMPPTVKSPTSNTDPKPVFKNSQTGTVITPDGVQKIIHIRKNAAETNLVYYLYSYDLGIQPAGRYQLMSPIALDSDAPYTGWLTAVGDERWEGWSPREAIKISLGSFLSLTQITVSNDASGYPYGYWGGIWADQGLS